MTAVIEDMVNHPKHYTSDPSGIECIEVTEDMPFCLGNAYKYLHRAAHKGSQLQDLEKCLWYAIRAGKRGQYVSENSKKLVNYIAGFHEGDKQNLLLAFANSQNPERLFDFIVKLQAIIDEVKRKGDGYDPADE